MGNETSKNKELTKNGSISGKHNNGSINGISTNIKSNGVATVETTEPDYMIVETDSKSAAAPIISELLETIIQKEEVKEINESPPDESLPAPNPQTGTANLKQESESLPEPESVTLDLCPVEETAPETVNGNIQPVETQKASKPEENPVMNFFKKIVTLKVTKETATPEATKEQSQECPPVTTTTVAQVSEPPPAPKGGMSIPPPPPPEPPKMEIKAELAAKPAKPTLKEEPKAAGKSPKASKGLSARVNLSNLFRPKKVNDEPPEPEVEVEVQPVVEVQETPEETPEPVVEVQSEINVQPTKTAEEAAEPVVEEQMEEEVPQPVVEAEKVDPSKAGTLEAALKPEPPPPVQEEKKTDSKPSFFSMFKSKAADPKKAPPSPAAAAETVKAKEEPKAAAKSEAVVENKPAAVAPPAGEDAAHAPRKLEKRNSIHSFFKTLGQRRSSTEAGVQTEQVPAAAAEKAK
ncbi:breast carcinoma-amplified sequence 1 isoform X1 [Notothenia coriiceps]|uniref:Breast carcinoma-amplified sequence 1 isoform X1 n=1 Tax=Notothenia coriiceps TaxID=8208 RepID=A0A6I9MSN7_9TELE|nr:PREDICTED: proteoglycan 4-like isoform X1 [Notothenia coriiceps]